MQGYVVTIEHPTMGATGPTIETVHVLSDDEAGAITLVRTALRIDPDLPVAIQRRLSGEEWRALGLKPYQVKHA